MNCPVCGGPLSMLSCLGRLLWFRCKACGLDVSQELEEEE